MADERLRYFIEAVWSGKGATAQASTDIANVGKAAEKGTAGTKKLEGGLTGLRNAFVGIAGLGIAVKLGREIAQFADISIKAASDAEESFAKFETVFRETAVGVELQLKAIADATGRSRFELVDFAATLQDTFVPLGFARDAAAEMSVNLVQLAIDLASFNNLNTADVVRDLQSALVGNVETLRKYGVVANETAIKAKALELGLWDGTGAIDAQSKASAILAITMAGTADAQGDAVRTADSLANRTRAAESATRDLQVATGQALQGWADMRVNMQLAITQAILPMIQNMADLVNASRELSAAVDDVVTREDIDNLVDYNHAIQLLREQAERAGTTLGAAGNPFRTLLFGDTSIVQARNDFLRLIGDAGQMAHDFQTLQAIMRGLGFDTDDLGVSFGNLSVSWIEVQRAIDAARLREKFAEIDASMGPVDKKLKNITISTEDAARATDLYSQALEKLAQAGRKGPLPGRIEPFEGVSGPSPHFLEFFNDIKAGGGSAAEAIARLRAEYVALVEAGRAERGGFFASFFDTDELGSVYGEFYNFTVNYSNRIEELRGELADMIPDEGDELTERQQERFAELTAELGRLEAAHGSVATAFATDTNMARFAGTILEVAAAGGAAGKQLLELAGNTDAAREALTNAAFQQFATNLGTQIADGTKTARDALIELQSFMENFDLDSFLNREGILGTGDTRALEIRQQTMGIVEGLNTVVREGTVVVEETAANATRTLEELGIKSDELQGPWPYEIEQESIMGAIRHTENLLELIRELEGVSINIPVSIGGSGGIPAVFAQHGANFTVPPGYNENFPIFASSGEHVQVTPAGAAPTTTTGGNHIFVNVYAAPGMSPAALIQQMRYQISQYGFGMQ